jgi:hypothetical protein
MREIHTVKKDPKIGGLASQSYGEKLCLVGVENDSVREAPASYPAQVRC